MATVTLADLMKLQSEADALKAKAAQTRKDATNIAKRADRLDLEATAAQAKFDTAKTEIEKTIQAAAKK